MQRFICSDETLNSYGFWVMTKGISLERFLKNPVMLWNHSRSYGSKDDVLPIGYWKDIRIENGCLTAEPVFDAKDDFAQQIASKVEQQVVRACSIGIRILTTSCEDKYMKPGQTRDTVIACELREISLCDIPANGNAVAVALYDEQDQLIGLSEMSDTFLPLFIKPNKKMEKVNEALGLLADATEELAVGAIKKLKDRIVELENAQKENTEKALRDMVNAAIHQRKITEDKRETYMSIGRKAGVEALRAVLEELREPMRPSDIIHHADVDTTDKKFSEYTADALESMRANDPQRYIALFEAEYGFKPEID